MKKLLAFFYIYQNDWTQVFADQGHWSAAAGDNIGKLTATILYSESRNKHILVWSEYGYREAGPEHHPMYPRMIEKLDKLNKEIMSRKKFLKDLDELKKNNQCN